MDRFERTMLSMFVVWFIIVIAMWGTIGYVAYRILTHFNIL